MEYQASNREDNINLSAVFHNGSSNNRVLPNIEDPDTETRKPTKNELERLGDLWIWPPPLL